MGTRAARSTHRSLFSIGQLFAARREEAHYRTLEAEQKLRDRQQEIARDVRDAWASAMNAYQALDVSAQLLRQATLGLSLAQARYDLQLASIIELTQAQLNLTAAAIATMFSFRSIRRISIPCGRRRWSRSPSRPSRSANC